MAREPRQLSSYPLPFTLPFLPELRTSNHTSPVHCIVIGNGVILRGMGSTGRWAGWGLASRLMLAASCVGGSSTTTPPALNPADVQVDQNTAATAVQLLNSYRVLGSIDPVVLDTDLSMGCQLHANYLTANLVSLSTVGLKAHTETPGALGYTLQGAKSGQNSVIYEGVTATQAVGNWMQTLYTASA